MAASGILLTQIKYRGTILAIVHTRLKVLSRSTRNTVAALAYRSGIELVDNETGEIFDYRHKPVEGVELLLPNDAPKMWTDLQNQIAEDRQSGVQRFSNIAEAHEKRVDAQVYREYEFALPRELTDDENKILAREFVQDQICGLGMAAKLNFHFDVDEEGNRFPHVHVVMLTRRLEKDGLSRLKERGWNRKEFGKELRFQFCEYANFHFKKKGLDITLDPRTYAEQGIDLEPQVKIGKNVSEMEARVGSTNRVKDYNEVRLSNQYKIISNPEIIVTEITKRQTTFTARDIQKSLNRYIDDRDLHFKLLEKIKALDTVITLGEEGVYTSRTLIEKEQNFLSKLSTLKSKNSHEVQKKHIQNAIAQTNDKLCKYDSSLSEDQVQALYAMVDNQRLSFIEGYAGAGKTTVIETAAHVWKQSGYNVVGLAPTNRAKESLKGAGIDAFTVHSFLMSYEANRQRFHKDTVLVLDEAGMVDLERYTALLKAVKTLGVKLVSVGDRGQLTPVEAGCPFTMASQHSEFTTLTTIIRQKQDWQKQATKAFGNGATKTGLSAYLDQQNIHFVKSNESHADHRFHAKKKLIQDWVTFTLKHPNHKACILAHANKDVADLNTQARTYMRKMGVITGQEFNFTIETIKEGSFGKTRVVREERSFAVGDQIVFTGNNKSLGVSNGSLGRIVSISKSKIKAEVDGEIKSFSPNLFKQFDLGWATTIHKSQGMTTDQTFVLGSRGLYANLSYVAMTRHRDDVNLYVSDQEFSTVENALDWFSRDNQDTIISQVMTAEKQREALKHEVPVLRKALQSTKNKLEAVSYVGTRLFNDWRGHKKDTAKDHDGPPPISQSSGELDKISNNPETMITESIKVEAKPNKNQFMDKSEFTRFIEKVNESIQGEDLANDLLRSRGLNEKSSSSHQLRFGRKGALQVTIEGLNANSWYDFETSEGGKLLNLIQRERNCDFKESLSIAADYCRGPIRSEIDRFLDGKSIDRASVENSPSKDKTEAKEAHQAQQRQKISDVKKLVDKSVPIKGSPAELYLRHDRNIQGELPDSLRYIPAKTEYTYDGKDKYVKSGAMISVAKSSEGDVKAVQLTYLTEEGTRACNHDGEKFAKITYGSAKGAYVTLQEGTKDQPFIMAEGVETALSIKEAGVKGQVVCSLGIGNYKNIIKDQENVIIAADWDGSTDMPTYKAAEDAKQQINDQGGNAQIILPVDSTKVDNQKVDFNDILQKKGISSVRELLNNQARDILKDKPLNYEPTLSRDQTETASHQHECPAENAPEMDKGESVEKAPEQNSQEDLKHKKSLFGGGFSKKDNPLGFKGMKTLKDIGKDNGKEI